MYKKELNEIFFLKIHFLSVLSNNRIFIQVLLIRLTRYCKDKIWHLDSEIAKKLGMIQKN